MGASGRDHDLRGGDSGGRGRAEGEEEKEGGGEECASGAVGALPAIESPELRSVQGGEGVGGAGDGAGALRAPVASPLPPGWGAAVAMGVASAVANDDAPDSGPVAKLPTRSKRASEATDDGAPDWATIRAEAEDLAPGPMGWVLWQEDRLARSGENFPALSPFTLYAIDGFFLSGKRWLLWMAGRGFGKSTLTSRIATAVGFGIERRAAPGPAWVCPLVSVLPIDAERRLDDIQQLLLHVYHQEVKPSKSMIAAKDAGGNSIAWVSSASTIGNVSGPSSFLALVDEEEKILYGRAGGIVGSLAFTFRSRPRVYGMRVSSAMTVNDTLARACAKGNGPGSPLTNHVVTLGPFLPDAVAGLLAVAAWEEARGNVEAATAIRTHALGLTSESWECPTWLGHPSIGRPTDDAPWGPGDAAIATRIEAEAVDEKSLDGLAPWRYWLRECASVPTGGDALDTGSDWEVLGVEHRNAGVMAEDRGYR